MSDAISSRNARAADAPTIEDALAILRRHEAELRVLGVERASIFGSVARGEATARSDIDVLVRVRDEIRAGGFSYVGFLETLRERLEELFQRPVDVTTEPVRKDRLRSEIERDGRVAF